MRCRVIGVYTVRGDEGVYVESLEYPKLYAACDYSEVPLDTIDTQTVMGQILDLPITRNDLYQRLEDCLPRKAGW